MGLILLVVVLGVASLHALITKTRTSHFADLESLRTQQVRIDQIGRLIIGHDADPQAMFLVVPGQPRNGGRLPRAEEPA